MANGTDVNTNGDGGTDWASIIQSGVQLVTTGIGAASASKTNCGQMCRQKCKAETGWLFSGRRQCKKKCKADCIAKQNEPPQKKPSPIPLIIISVIVLSIIALIIWWMVKKK